MKNKFGFNIIFALIAFPIGLALIKDIDFENLTLKKPALDISIHRNISIFTPFPMIESRISRTNLFNTVFQKTSITSEIKILAEPIKRIIQFQSSGPAEVVKILLISILQGWIFLFSNPFHIISIHVQMQSRFQCFTFMKGMLMIQVKTSYITG